MTVVLIMAAMAACILGEEILVVTCTTQMVAHLEDLKTVQAIRTTTLQFAVPVLMIPTDVLPVPTMAV